MTELILKLGFYIKFPFLAQQLNLMVKKSLNRTPWLSPWPEAALYVIDLLAHRDTWPAQRQPSRLTLAKIEGSKGIGRSVFGYI